MSETRFVSSPVCQLPERAVTALEQAGVDELLEPGAFTAMSHLPAAGVLADALDYADRLVGSLGAEDLASAHRDGVLVGAAELMPADAAFLSQVLGLVVLAAEHDVVPDKEAEEGMVLGGLVEDARARLVERVSSWRQEPGRRSAGLRVQVGEGGVVWPSAVVPVEAGDRPAVGSLDADVFVLFGALPVLAPFLGLEEDCFVAPRLE
jgi:hypothetical protein